ncbi:hypothetical protein [Mucilaginibacter myungsuensis]|uniref:YD repeat-containing protein n=1 Tax=Mucilaginibacter myungsuensis TaxID=649104 RepID=A0A929L2C1_9SPHI|nr:hypothetical protein [Mucilaginibacter myungsuensis]MBE9662805.1 hypothetical protein [Mucilaginibacter myungsuensis]MDN3598225.1 hypothetical protein [Mucilaginibacter myungsuensis]
MKKQFTLAMACVAMLFVFSCKNTSTPEPTNDDNTPKKVKVPIKITYSRKLQPGEPGFGNTVDGYQTTFTTFAYDDKKRLSIRLQQGVETRFTYDANGRVGGFTTTNGTTLTEATISYEGDLVKTVRSKTYVNGALALDYVYTYNYTGNKLMEIIHKWDGQLAATYQFTYTGANPTKMTVRDISNPMDQEFTYDDKKTPYDNLSAKVALSLPVTPFSLNNVLTRANKLINIANNTSSATNVYTYDADGFPKTQVSTSLVSQSPTPSETRSTIEYTEL